LITFFQNQPDLRGVLPVPGYLLSFVFVGIY
jgi:hypothetical protein